MNRLIINLADWRGLLGAGLFLLSSVPRAVAQTDPNESFPSYTFTNHLGWTTNGPFIIENVRTGNTNSSPTNSPWVQVVLRRTVVTNLNFVAYRPESLGNLIWTNFAAHATGREMRTWSERIFPRYATNVLQARWNTNGLMWGMKGLTALSPHWEADQGTGHSPFTALTRRHAYTRGHGSGGEGITLNWSGQKVWFLTRENKVVEAKVKWRVVRTREHGGDADYAIALLDRDLPPTIEPIRVTSFAEVQSHYPFPADPNYPHPIFMTEQGGLASALVRPWLTDVGKGGDSGCPNLLPLPGELVFFGGRSTTGPTPAMQADMDELCRQEKLDPRKYQLQWVDLSRYPNY